MFHEVRFPEDISLQSSGGPERLTEIVTLGSSHEERNSRWAHSRRRYNAGYGVKSLSEISKIVDFFEARHGRLYGFRWRDYSDYKSCSSGNEIQASDQLIGMGDGETVSFQ